MGASSATDSVLKAERAKIVAEIAELQKGLEHIDWVIRRVVPDTTDDLFSAANTTASGEATMAEHVERVMKDRGHPMTLREVVDQLLVDGVYSDAGKKLYNRVSATLSARKQRFQRVGKGTYQLIQPALLPQAHRQIDGPVAVEEPTEQPQAAP